MPRMRLNENSPEAEKVAELFDFMEKNKVSIQILDWRTIVTVNGKDFEIEDMDNGEPVKDFPASMEWKLCYDKVPA